LQEIKTDSAKNNNDKKQQEQQTLPQKRI